MADEPTTEATDEADSAPEQERGEDRRFTQADLDRVVSERVARERAKYSDYSDLKRKAAAAMTEQEKAVAEAEARGHSTAMAAAGRRLALAELRASAAGRVEQATLDGFLEYADLSRFVSEDGEPDTKAIAAAVKRLGGTGGNAPDFDGGARQTSSNGNDMNAFIRRQAGVS